MQNNVNTHVLDYFVGIAAHHLNTALHSIRVGKSAELIGSKECLDGKLLYEMGLVHDVGKKVVPIRILSLEDRAPNKDEFEIIRQHTVVGYDMLKDVLPLHACIAGKHHPSYAVKDYPSSLSLDERFFVDRCVPILTLCDFYDALMTRHNVAYRGVDRRNVESIRIFLEINFKSQKEHIDILLNNPDGPFARKKRIA